MSKISNTLKNNKNLEINNQFYSSETETPINGFIDDKLKPKIMGPSTDKEMVHHPDHYDMADKTYEPYKVINAWGANFNIGNAIKYLARYKKKWNPIEDLEKAKQYIDFEIECLKTGSDVIDVMNKQLKEAVKDIDFNLGRRMV